MNKRDVLKISILSILFSLLYEIGLFYNGKRHHYVGETIATLEYALGLSGQFWFLFLSFRMVKDNDYILPWILSSVTGYTMGYVISRIITLHYASATNQLLPAINKN